MLTPEEKSQVEKDLEKCSNVKEIFDYLNQKFDLQSAKLGFGSKSLFIGGIIKAINLVNAKRK
jgi:hypothetical protein